MLLPLLAPAACRSGGAHSARSKTPTTQASSEGPGPEWAESGRSQRYVGQDLFNHIDGAGELFLEMGFREVTVRRYSHGDAALVREVYEMKDSTAARGMYLHLRGRGTPVAGVAGRNFGNRYQIAAQKDRYYVQVTNLSGEVSSLPAMVKLVNQATAALPKDGDVPLLKLLPAEGLVAGSESIVTGPYSLQSVFVLGEGDILQLQGQGCGIAGDYQTEREGSLTRLIIAYGRAEAAAAAFQHLLQGLDGQLQVLRKSEPYVVFRDAKGQFGSVTASGDTLDIRLHLAREPSVADSP